MTYEQDAKRLKKSGRHWTTESELLFLKHLGQWNPHHNGLWDRKHLLQMYLDTMYLRVDWGSINEKVIRAAAKNMLAQEK